MLIKKIIYSSINFLFDKYMGNFVDEDIIMFLKNYKSDVNEEFLREFRKIILFTYRYNFQDILSKFRELDRDSLYKNIKSDPTTDIGWGCMIRVTQMSILQGIRVHLKRIKRDDISIKELIDNFQDNNDSVFSIHNMVFRAYYNLGISPFSWIGPTTSSVIADILINENIEILYDQQISSIVFKDGTLYKNITEKHFSKIRTKCCTFIWLCTKLGATNFNVDAYKNSILLIMKLVPQFACISGGHNNFNRALLVVGASINYLYCLDPHTKILPSFSKENFDREEFIQNKPIKINWEDLSPSLSLVFVCSSFSDFEEMCLNLRRINSDLFETIEYKIMDSNIEFETDSDFLVL
ncbi:hypothetical protein FG386_003215 [Cryptosporidium ryanae]|uniref:uncharacterized protein n=1 Tax=Cryptosporidium ryanae TaxID=515981 RepID=UPI003519FB62|nr:hypothetical protein FG386_003215 [Cryptosporidium ryanae]